ncbi:interleukin-12 subunit alpha isoform X2 [Erinaceus europaeus]|uniref:Interleukin-12 subunit alpha n=1 Tax=Erinaceus europaeus TaxID=9365 RepID=A0ABM3XXL8_ERIEU|nr:interleukin-12 subunit alpha isoform X2 [Erinaceus europaeus]
MKELGPAQWAVLQGRGCQGRGAARRGRAGGLGRLGGPRVAPAGDPSVGSARGFRFRWGAGAACPGTAAGPGEPESAPEGPTHVSPRQKRDPGVRESPGAWEPYKNGAPAASQSPPSPAAAAVPSRSAQRPRPAPSPHRPARPPSMSPQSSLLVVATLALLSASDHLSLAPSIFVTSEEPGIAQCLSRSQKLLQAVSNTLQKARQTLELYPCSPEETDHEDITKDKTSTVEACLPMELAMNGSCVTSRKASSLMNGSCMTSRKASSLMDLCLSSIYEDLKMYQLEFKTMNATLLMDPKRQIFLDQNLMMAIGELMQGLKLNSENTSQNPALEELDFYKMKTKLCILLHAFRVRVVTINRMMTYLSS